MIRKYFQIWLVLATNSFKTQASTSLASAGYLIGKFVRFAFFLAYLLAIFSKLPSLKGYDMPAVVLFFMTFNLIDVGAQFMFRGLYGVKMLIDEGDFDKILTQPANVLFRVSSMGVDLLDLLTLIPIGAVTIWTLTKLTHPVTASAVLIYFLLLVNAMVIAYSIHVIVGGMSVRTQEFESAIWVYRDVMTLGRFPVNVYSEVMRGIFITVIPVGIMVSYPADALLGLLSWKGVSYALFLGVVFFTFAQLFWKQSLRLYTSNSS
jgi:ABC-2 type transport system permease protein